MKGSKLTELEKQKAIKKLTEMRGFLKGQAKMSDEEAKELAFKEIAKKLNIKSD